MIDKCGGHKHGTDAVNNGCDGNAPHKRVEIFTPPCMMKFQRQARCRQQGEGREYQNVLDALIQCEAMKVQLTINFDNFNQAISLIYILHYFSISICLFM